MSAALRFAVIGSPVGHSRSPAMHAAAYAALGMAHSYEKLETSEAELPARVAALRDGVFAGLNVTIPHKEGVLALVDDVSEGARALGAANTLVRTPEGRVVAHNTDAPALREELARLGAASLAGRSALVLGTGGAARAAVAALGALGASRIVIRGRSEARARSLLSLAPSSSFEIEPLAAPANERADLGAIVQATSCGMHGGPPGALVAEAVAWPSVPAGAAALDVVYVPRRTPFLERAAERGLASDDGLGMLARQGALAFSLWLGVEPPLDAMLAAL